jgi:integrase
MKRQSVQLADGRTIQFSLKQRAGEPCYFVCFRGKDGRRLERSTKQASQKRASDSAIAIIKEEYTAAPVLASLTWEEAEAALVRAMRANNNRQTSIDDYLLMIKNVREMFSSTRGPTDITPSLAKLFKTRRMEAGLSAYTVAGNLTKLSSIWGKWWTQVCEVLAENPWEGVEKPKVDEKKNRYIDPEEEAAFFAYMLERWQGWRLPVLFYTVKGLLGCRILQLCSAKSNDLRDGRLFLSSETAKGRKNRNPKLPAVIFAELDALKGPTWLWEKFPEQLNALFVTRRLAKGCLPDFEPKRLKWWLQDEITRYNKLNADKPGFVPFTSHNFRGTAMSTAIENGATIEDAALAFACSPSTIKRHYLVRDNEQVADDTLDRVFSAKQKATGDGHQQAQGNAEPQADQQGK